MTIRKAIEHLLKSEKFQVDARKDARLRVFLERYRNGTVKEGAMVNLLQAYNYKINVEPR